MFLHASKQKRCREFWHLWLVKVKVTLQYFLLHLLTSFYFESFSFSSNNLDNNFGCDTNLLMLMSSLLITNKKVLSCSWLGTNNNFWCCQELKMWISGALFEQMRFSFNNLTHVVFWTKVENFYKNPLKRSVHKSQFQSPRNLVEKNLFFHHSRKNNSKFTTRFLRISKSRLNTSLTKYKQRFFQLSQLSLLLNFLINWHSNVA